MTRTNGSQVSGVLGLIQFFHVWSVYGQKKSDGILYMIYEWIFQRLYYTRSISVYRGIAIYTNKAPTTGLQRTSHLLNNPHSQSHIPPNPSFSPPQIVP